MTLVRYTYPTARSLAPFARSPWAGLESEIDRLFQSSLGDFSGSTATRRVPVDLYEDKDNTYVRADLPGVNRDDINVELVDGYLTITAARKTKTGDREDSVSLTRSVSVPDAAVQADKITASYENGVLTVTLPKREEAKPRKVTVAVK
ncbi:MAG: Hsp20/alpha crystallin family protein [Opitutaceae bacterium]|nr:Hsp20/alpha crystallin family protein [Opitutaceae bacterium]